MQTLERAINMNGVTHIVFNKVDVLRAVGEWAVIDNRKVVKFKTEKAMSDFIVKRLKSSGISRNHIFFSESKDKI